MSNTMFKSVTLIIFSALVFGITSARTRSSSTETPESWTGRWFPERPVSGPNPNPLKVDTERPPMGVEDPNCDDAKTNLTLDWDNSFLDYTCDDPRNRIEPDHSIVPMVEYENIPIGYEAPHLCMNTPISYDNPIPTFGPHRPLWGKWGTFKYLPKQRWLHNLEHGGIVALYHPCADLKGISIFKKLVKGCLRRHIITPIRGISRDRPFALVAWGIRLRMSVPHPDIVRDFIKNNAIRGPEMTPEDGLFTMFFQEAAEIVSDIDDTRLCPNGMVFE